MSLLAVPLPLSEKVVLARNWKEFPDPKESDPREGTITLRWAEYLTRQADLQVASPRRVYSVSLTDQDAAIGATDLTDGTVAAGLYRLSYYATIVVAATTSSSLTITLDWTDRGQTKDSSGAAITGNAITVVQSNSLLIRVDRNSPIRYSTAYASVGGTAMAYDLIVCLERVE